MENVKVKTKSGSTTTLENEKKIASVFISNGISSTLIIPIKLARKCSIDKPSQVTIEDTQNRLLIKKLEIN
jgi:hypothetical protein